MVCEDCQSRGGEVWRFDILRLERFVRWGLGLCVNYVHRCSHGVACKIAMFIPRSRGRRILALGLSIFHIVRCVDIWILVHHTMVVSSHISHFLHYPCIF